MWVHDHAEELGADPTRIIVAGTSAGGGLAAAVSLMARDRGGPPLAGQLLLAPMLDDRNNSDSCIQMQGVDRWDREWNAVGWSALLGARAGGPDVSPYAAPSRETNLSGLPPAYIDVGAVETFRDEDIAYAHAMWRGGGDAELHVWRGGVHSFDHLHPTAPVSLAARATRLGWIRRVLRLAVPADAPGSTA